MKWFLTLFGILLQTAIGAETPGQMEELSRALKQAQLDPEACYRVREFNYRRNEVRIYLTEGVLMFRKPVNGVRTGAVFIASEELEDAEVLLLPPNRMERKSLASFTGSPTLDEHFRSAAFLFTDGTGERWIEELNQSATARRSPERGVLVAEHWNPVIRNLSDSLEPRLLEDLSNGGGPAKGFFFAAISGQVLGNFDIFFDPHGREEFFAGQLEHVEGRNRYNFWTHFEPKRSEPRPMPTPAAKIESFDVQAEIGDDLRFKATVKMRLKVNRDGLVVVPMDLSPRLRVKSARWNGENVEIYQREALRSNLLRNGDSEALLFRPSVPLKAGESGLLEVVEEGDLFFRSGNGVLYLATRASWFPQMHFQAAPFQASFEHPKSLMLVCPGVRTETSKGERKVTNCKVDRPVRLFGFNLGSFESSKVSRGGFEIEVYANKTIESALARRSAPVMVPQQPVPPQRRRIEVPVASSAPMLPPDPLSRMPLMAEEIAGALEFFSSIFGPPPLSRVVAAPIPGAFGQGFPGFLYLSTLAYLEDSSLPISEREEWQRRNFREILQAHELAHQWWGNQVSFDNYRDEWISEAMSNYSALLYLEKRKGAKAIEPVLEEYKRRLLLENKEGKMAESHGPLVFGIRLRYSDPAAWHAITYGKGTWVLHMLRSRLGDASFLQVLGQLAREFSDKPMNTEDLRRIAAAKMPKDSPDPELTNFFETWVYGTGIPQLEMTSVVKGLAPRAVVEVRIKRTKVSDDFALDVPVEIQLPRGQKMIRWIRNESSDDVVEIRSGAVPLKVSLDPRGVMLKR